MSHDTHTLRERIRAEILGWMNKGIPDGKTIPVFEDLLDTLEAAARAEEREKVFNFQRRMYKSQIPMDIGAQKMFEEAVNTRDASKAVWIWQNTITDAYNQALSDVAQALTPTDYPANQDNNVI